MAVLLSYFPLPYLNFMEIIFEKWKKIFSSFSSPSYFKVVLFSAFQLNGWYPEIVFLTVVFLNSADIAVVIPNSTVKR